MSISDPKPFVRTGLHPTKLLTVQGEGTIAVLNQELRLLAIAPVEKGALLFRIEFQQPLGHTALTEDNTLADKPTPVLLDQLSPFTPVLGNLGR